jgi:hypothetical protein
MPIGHWFADGVEKALKRHLDTMRLPEEDRESYLIDRCAEPVPVPSSDARPPSRTRRRR